MNGNYAASIGEDLSRAEAMKDGIPEVVGMLRIRSANETLIEAQRRPDPKPLWLSLWYEGEVCCLFADSNLGKSIYAVQIGESIAKTERVLYFDFELSDKQFQLRYTDEQGNLNRFSKDFLRVEIDKESLEVTNFEDKIIKDIEASALQSGARVLIIDNLTWLCVNSEKGDEAGQFMKRLMALKKKYDLSMLIIAHTPKRNQSNPITTNDLAGSKKLYNFFDSCFAIGQSAKDGGLRYIKQMKVRHGEFVYDAENVIVCQVEKNGTFLQFATIGYATEREHLKQQSECEVSHDLVHDIFYKQQKKFKFGQIIWWKNLYNVLKISNFEEIFKDSLWLLTSRHHRAKIANYSTSCTPISEKQSICRVSSSWRR